MHEKTLKLLDPLIAFALLLATPLAWLAGLLLRRERHGTALIRPGGMGDLICLQIATGHVPRLAGPVTYFIDGRSAAWAQYQQLRSIRYDLKTLATLLAQMGRFEKVIVTEQRFGAAAAYGLLLAAGRRSRVYGFATQKARVALGHCEPYAVTREHETSAFSRLLFAAAGEPDHPELGEARLRRGRCVPAQGDDLWVCVAGRGVPSRELSPAAFAAIAAGAAAGRQVVITAQPSDLAFAGEMIALLPRARVFEGKFADLCNALAHAPEVMTIDGGMVHVCSFFGVPTKTLFTAGIIDKWRPLAEGSVVAVSPSELPCRPCARFGQVPPCPIKYACKVFPSNILALHAH